MNEFNCAVTSIEHFLEHYTSPYSYKLANKTTNSYEELREFVQKNGYMIITLEGNDTSMYSASHFNTLARWWHDTVHLMNDLDFSYEDECKVAEKQIQELKWYLAEKKFSTKTIENACALIHIDVIEQYKYYQETGTFLEYQKSFVIDRFNKRNKIGV